MDYEAHEVSTEYCGQYSKMGSEHCGLKTI